MIKTPWIVRLFKARKMSPRAALTRLLIFLAILFSVAVWNRPAMAAGIPVFDGVSTANQLVEISHAVTQIKALNDQLMNMQDQLKAVTGSRGLGSFGVNGTVRNYLPDDFANIASSSSSLSNEIKSLTNSNSVLTEEELARMPPAQRDLLMKLRNQVATQQATSQSAYRNASQSVTRLQALMDAINSTNDQKSISELQARIQAEQTMLQNDQIKLQQAAQAMQASQHLITQQKQELAQRFLGQRKKTWAPLSIQ